MLGNLHCFSPHVFLCKAIRNLSTQQHGRGIGCTQQLSYKLQLWIMERYKVEWLSEEQLSSFSLFCSKFLSIDWWETLLIPKNPNKTSFHIWLEEEHMHWRRRRTQALKKKKENKARYILEICYQLFMTLKRKRKNF